MKNRTAGFTLIEVLIAILVLSFGMLAIAALQFRTLETSQNSNGRGIASSLAAALAEEMQTNRAQLTAGSYNRTLANMPAAGANVPACFTASGCSAADLVTNNLANWQSNLQALLGGNTAHGLVCIDSNPVDLTYDGNKQPQPVCDNVAGAPYVIYIWWQDNRNNETLATNKPYQIFSVSVQP